MRDLRTVLFGLLFCLIFSALPSFAYAISAPAILELVNAERRNAGLSPVEMNAKLSKAGQIKAQDMASNGYFDHVSPEGVDPWDLLARVGYDCEWSGENLGLSSDMQNEAVIVRAWMDSPGHKAIIMDARYTETGIGIAEGEYQGRKVVLVSQFFGLPKEAPIQTTQVATQTVAQPTQPVQPIKTEAKPVSKTSAVVNSVIKKAEAEEVLQATTTAAVESSADASLKMAEHPVVIKASLFTRIKLFFSRLFTFSA